MRHQAKFRTDRLNFCGDNGRFSIFQEGGRPPSSICFTCIWSIHEEHLLVFVTVQNLVGIGAVVSIICSFNVLRVWLENAYSRPFLGGFEEFDPLDETQYQPISQKFHLRVIAVPAAQRYITYTGVCSSSRETAWTKKM